MTIDKPEPSGVSSSAGSQDGSKPARPVPDGAVSEKGPVAARLSTYYADIRLKPAVFLKAVRTEKIRAFDAQDVSNVVQRLGETDPTLARTVALLGKRPHAASRWVVEATKAALKLYLPEAASDAHETSKRLFDRVVRMSAEDLATKDKQLRTRTQNLVRLVLAWLVAERDLQPTDALVSIRNAAKKKEGGLTRSPNRDIGGLLRRARFSQLLDLSLVAAFFESAIAQEARERQGALSNLDKWRDRATSLETELQATNEKLRETIEELNCRSNELSSTQKELREEKELRTLDATQQSGRWRAFLSGRLRPLLSDARDALDFDPPHTDATRQLIKIAMTEIDNRMEKINE